MMIRHKILLALCGLVLSLVILELFLRLNPKFGYRYGSFKFKAGTLDLNDVGNLRPSPLLGYEYIPNCIPKINSYGLIGKEYKIKKDKGAFRILLIGDSIVGQGWPGKFLEKNLNKLHSRHKFELWNSGVGSYDVRRYAIFLKYQGLNYNPDMAIVYLFMNDFRLDTSIYYKTEQGTMEYQFPISEISKIYIPNPFFMRHSYLYRFIVLRLNSFLIAKKETKGTNPQEEAGRYYLRMIKQICQRNKIPLYVVIFPYLKPLDEYDSWEKSEYLIINKVLKESGIPYYNLYNLYLQLIERGFPLRESNDDDIHPSREAHRLIAEQIYDNFLVNFIN